MEVVKILKKKENSTVELVKLKNKAEQYVIKYYKNFSRSMLIEINILATQHHPNIVTIKRIGIIDDEYIGVIMPVIKNNMRDIFYSPKYQKKDKINILLQISYGLGFLHDNNIVHCDLKPENIMIEKNHAYIIDFGCAEYLLDGYTKTKYLKCTATHRPPEGFDTDDDGFYYIDKKFDVWSFGITMLEVFGGCEIHRLEIAPKYNPKDDADYIVKYDQEILNFFKSVIFKNYYRTHIPKIFWKSLAKKSVKRPEVKNIIQCLEKIINGDNFNEIYIEQKNISDKNIHIENDLFAEYNKIINTIKNTPKYRNRYPDFIITATCHLISKLNSVMGDLSLEYIHHAIFLCNKFNSVEKMVPIEKIIPNFQADMDIITDIIIKTGGKIF